MSSKKTIGKIVFKKLDKDTEIEITEIKKKIVLKKKVVDIDIEATPIKKKIVLKKKIKEIDCSLRKFYESLFQQSNGRSKMSIDWLNKHDILEENMILLGIRKMNI